MLVSKCVLIRITDRLWFALPMNIIILSLPVKDLSWLLTQLSPLQAEGVQGARSLQDGH